MEKGGAMAEPLGGVKAEPNRPLRRQGFMTQGPPTPWRRAINVGLPALIVLNMVLFAIANIIYAAEEKFSVAGAFENLPETTVFNFNLPKSMRLMWKSGAYAICLIIIVLSGAWPYIKLLTMLSIWFYPLTERVQAKLLWWLDVLGKWSFVDMFFMVIMVVSFRQRTTVLPGTPFASTTDIGCAITAGFYVFMIAALMSLFITDCMVWIFHWGKDRRCATPGAQSLLSHVASWARSGTADLQSAEQVSSIKRLFWTLAGPGVVVLMVGAGVMGVFGGFFFDFVSFHYTGALFQPQYSNGTSIPTHIVPTPVQHLHGNVSSFSLVDFATELPAAVWEDNKAGAVFVSVVYVGLSLVLPLMVPLMSFVLWVVPMRAEFQVRINSALQFFAAWASTDVVLLAVVAGVVELNTLVQGTQRQLPDNIAQMQQLMCGNPNPNPQCIGDTGACGQDCIIVKVEPLAGFWLLLGSVLFTYVAYFIVEYVNKVAVEPRQRAESETRPLAVAAVTSGQGPRYL